MIGIGHTRVRACKIYYCYILLNRLLESLIEAAVGVGHGRVVELPDQDSVAVDVAPPDTHTYMIINTHTHTHTHTHTQPHTHTA
jgi:hypothetical protein